MSLKTDAGDRIFGKSLLAASRKGRPSNTIGKKDREFKKNRKEFWLEDRGKGAICVVNKEITTGLKNIKEKLKSKNCSVEHKEGCGLKGKKIKGECKDFDKSRKPVPHTARHKTQKFEIIGKPALSFVDMEFKPGKREFKA